MCTREFTILKDRLGMMAVPRNVAARMLLKATTLVQRGNCYISCMVVFRLSS